MYKKEILDLLKSVSIDAEESQLERPPQREFGDVSFPCFHLAKTYKKNPVQIASDLVSKIKIPKTSIVSRVETKGAYINFFFDYEKFSSAVIKSLSKKPKASKKVMIEYSSPNPIHPIHIGHARNTFLGDSLANIMDFLGYDAVRANLMNDVGLQVAKLVYAYTKWADYKKPEGKPDLWLWQYYIKVHDEIKKDQTHEEKSKEMLKEYEEDSNDELSKKWNAIVKWCVDGFEETYKRLGIKFDVYFYEHEFRDAGKKVVQDALKKGFAKKIEDGAVLADLEKTGLPNTILLRSNGTGLYITSDLGLTIEKFSKYNVDESVWVSDVRQSTHFKQVFKIFELLGYKWYKACHHLDYEMVDLQEGKMSSREGKAILIDDVLDKLAEKAYKEVEKRNVDLSEKEKRSIAEKIAIGAFKYAMVRIEPHSKITFDWDQMLSLEGNTGPYIQYAHTRCLGILKKAGKFKKTYTSENLTEDETSLISKLSQFHEVVKKAADERRPHYVCNYVYELATEFNSFYQKVPVTSAEDEKQKSFRLTLVDSTRSVIEKCLGMIGSEVPGKM